EGALQRMLLAQALDGRHLGAFDVRERHQAGAHGFAIHQDGAGAALALAASLLGPREPALLPQHVEQPRHRRDVHVDLAGVQAEAHAASLIVSGSAGIERTSIPRCRMAFTTAGAGPSMGSSPRPLAPNGPPA